MDQPLELKSEGNVKLEGREITAPIPSRDDVRRAIGEAAMLMRRIILDVKKLPRDKALEPHQDELRCLAQAQTNLQTGLMWLRRAVEQTREF